MFEKLEPPFELFVKPRSHIRKNLSSVHGRTLIATVGGSNVYAERETRRIARDFMDEPHIAGRRVSVRQVYALVEVRDVNPETVADRYDLDVADVYHALAYYHDHPREMSDVEAEREAVFEDFQESIERPDGVEPDTA
ncbi:DUF433 domain-containing protein [Halolamina sp.]|uniref:DUF433 domain-containing protein n=1 Tax=Halolamina sp. TaxID=1940283 RepID=UPI003567CFCC